MTRKPTKTHTCTRVAASSGQGDRGHKRNSLFAHNNPNNLRSPQQPPAATAPYSNTASKHPPAPQTRARFFSAARWSGVSSFCCTSLSHSHLTTLVSTLHLHALAAYPSHTCALDPKEPLQRRNSSTRPRAPHLEAAIRGHSVPRAERDKDFGFGVCVRWKQFRLQVLEWQTADNGVAGHARLEGGRQMRCYSKWRLVVAPFCRLSFAVAGVAGRARACVCVGGRIGVCVCVCVCLYKSWFCLYDDNCCGWRQDLLCRSSVLVEDTHSGPLVDALGSGGEDIIELKANMRPGRDGGRQLMI